MYIKYIYQSKLAGYDLVEKQPLHHRTASRWPKGTYSVVGEGNVLPNRNVRSRVFGFRYGRKEYLPCLLNPASL